MCGIAGIVSEGYAGRTDVLCAMRDAMIHRGPDHMGLWCSADGCAEFAHARLAVIDLSVRGHQPMSDVSGDLCIVLNGEIYNYQDLRRELECSGHTFRSTSDTEVVLEAYRAWGIDCLERLNGAFAFALYDRRECRVLLVRDRAGEKPLFYRHTESRLVFASELKALMADPALPRRLDLESLDLYFAYGYVPHEKCILQGCCKLPQGHAMIYDFKHNDLRVWRYWNLPESCPDPKATADELSGDIEELLTDSVRRRLVADVPVGVLLSGGLDSSLITAIATKISSKPIKTYTVSFPGHGDYNEGPHARAVADQFGTEHTELIVEPSSVDILSELASQFDEPIADHSIIPMALVSRLVKSHVTVALGGDGGDELFGGYPHYNHLQKNSYLRRFIPSSFRTRISKFATDILPMGFKGRNHLIGLAGDMAESIAHVNLYFDADCRRRMLPMLRDCGYSAERYKAGLCTAGHSPLQQATRVDFQTTMVDGYLVKVDRASMLYSLEVRAPFLDHRLIEYAYGRMPDAQRATAWNRKVLLRQIARRLLPQTFDFKRKQGFTLPLESWFEGRWGKYVEEVLRESGNGIYDRKTVDQLMAGQRRGHANMNRLFAMTMFELWRRKYRIGI